jgi:hypothetical protein
MRSSKNRSRSKSNRQRTIGNIINRVFDSSGPESKVRGTPQQIIEKYLQLARDAQLSNDRVAEQNFLQHAEHYTRMLGEATAEMQREQEARQQFGGQNGQGQNNQNNQGQGGQQGNAGDRPSYQNRERYDNRAGDRDDSGSGYVPYAGDPQPDIAPEPRGVADDGPGIVETPEARNQSQRRNDQRPRDDRPREERPREDRPREERPRDDRRKPYQDRREPVAAAEPAVAVLEEPSALPAFITAAAPVAEPKVARAPRKPKVKAEEPDTSAE